MSNILWQNTFAKYALTWPPNALVCKYVYGLTHQVHNRYKEEQSQIGHDRVNIFDSGAIFYLCYHRNQWSNALFQSGVKILQQSLVGSPRTAL